MADATRSIFNKKATEKLRSPDDLDKYVRVTNPSVWVLLAACLCLIFALLAWGFFGAVTTNVTKTGVAIDGKAMCFLASDEIADIDPGDVSSVGGKRMRVAEVSPVPISPGEAKKILKDDYLVSALVSGDWAYVVTFEGDTSELSEGIPISVNITTNRVAPISLTLRNWG